MENEKIKREFEERISECERELYGYIFGMIPNHADAHDVFQEATVRLWANFDRYDRSLPFGSWARKFAHTEVLKAFEKGKYRQWMAKPFSLDAVAQLASEFENHSGVLELRRRALEQCLEELEDSDVDLLKDRYWNKSNLREIAQEKGVPEHRLYRSLSNIRQWLQKCIDLRIGAAE